MPPVTTDASGVATFLFNTTGNELLKFRIIVENLDLDGNQTADIDDDVMAAHIHLAPHGPRCLRSHEGHRPGDQQAH